VSDPDAVTVQVRDGSHCTVLDVSGGLFADTVEPLRAALASAVTADRPRAVLDLSGVALMDSAGANLMVQTYRTADGYGGRLRLAGVQPMVRHVLEITNLTRILPIYPSARDAVRGEPPAGGEVPR